MPFTYKQEVIISYSGTALTDYQICITLDTATLISSGKMQSDCDDLYVYDSDKITQLKHWIQPETKNTATTKIWTKIPSIPNGGKSVWFYYGDVSAVNTEDIDNTFLFGDDFTDGVAGNNLNATKWPYSLGTWKYVNDDGVIAATLNASVADKFNRIMGNISIDSPCRVFCCSRKVSSEYDGLFGFLHSSDVLSIYGEGYKVNQWSGGWARINKDTGETNTEMVSIVNTLSSLYHVQMIQKIGDTLTAYYTGDLTAEIHIDDTTYTSGFATMIMHFSKVASVYYRWIIATKASSVEPTNSVVSNPPTVTSITPDNGGNDESINVTIGGTNFAVGASTKLRLTGESDISGTNVVVVSASEITCTFDITAAELGNWDAEVTNDDGDVGTFSGGFEVRLPYPEIDYINVGIGYNDEEIDVIITGEHFRAGAIVILKGAGFADIIASPVTVVSGTTIACTFDLEGEPVGMRDLYVENSDGSNDTLGDAFSVEHRLPAFTDMYPLRLHIGDILTIEGYGFGSAQNTSTVTIDGVEARVDLWSHTIIKVYVPEPTISTNGYVDVLLTVGSDEVIDSSLWLLLGGILRFVNPLDWDEIILDLDNGGEGETKEIWRLQDTQIPLPSTESIFTAPDMVDGEELAHTRLTNKEATLSLLFTADSKDELDIIFGSFIVEIYKETGCLEYRPERSSKSIYYTYYRVLEQPDITDYFTHKDRAENYAWNVVTKLMCSPTAEMDEEEVDVAYNLFYNGSFENQLDGYTKIESGSGAVTIDTTRFLPTGSKSCQLLTTDADDIAGIIDSDFTLVDSDLKHNFQLFAYKQSGTIHLTATLHCYDEDGVAISNLIMVDDKTPSGAAWEDIVQTNGEPIIYPEDSMEAFLFPASTAKIKLEVQHTGAAGVVSIDGILLTVSEYLSDGCLEAFTGIVIPQGVFKGHMPADLDIYLSNAHTPGRWGLQNAGITSALYGVDFAAANAAIAVGALGKILFNDSLTWEQKLSGTTVTLYGINRLDATHFWAVGQNGIVLFSADGDTWTAQPYPILPELFLPMGSMESWSSSHNNIHWSFSGTYGAVLNRSTDRHSGTYSARIQFPAAYASAVTDMDLEIGSGFSWTYWDRTINEGNVIRSSTAPHSGSRGAYFMAYGSGFGGNNKIDAAITSNTKATIDPSNTYKVGVWYLSPDSIVNGTVKGFLTALFYTSGGTYLGSKYVGVTTNNDGDWHQVALDLTPSLIPNNATRMKLKFSFSGKVPGPGGGIWYLDDFSLTTVSTAKATGTLTTKTSYLKSIDSRRSYRASFWVKGYGSKNHYQVRVYFYSSSKAFLGSHTICSNTTVPTAWTQKSHTLTTADYPVGTAYIGFYFFSDDSTSWAGRWVQFDDVSIKQAIPPNLKSVCPISTSIILAVGDWGTIIKSTDGGSTWTEKPSGVTVNLNSIVAQTSTTLYIVGDDSVALKSTDAGETWTQFNVLTSEIPVDLNDIYILDSSHRWIVADNGIILFSSDGIVWTPQTCPTNEDIYSIDGYDSTHIWACGANGALLSCSGVKWSIESLMTSSTLRSISVLDDTNVIAVGDNGVIIRGLNTVTVLPLTDLVMGQGKGYSADYNPVLNASGDTMAVLGSRRCSSYRQMAAGETQKWLFNLRDHTGTYLISVGGGINNDVDFDQIEMTLHLEDMAGNTITPDDINTEPSSLDLSVASGYKTVGVFREVVMLTSKFDDIDFPPMKTSKLIRQNNINVAIVLTAPSGMGGVDRLLIDCVSIIPVDDNCYIAINDWQTGVSGAQGTYMVLSSTDGFVFTAISETIESSAVFNPLYTTGKPNFKAKPTGVNITMMASLKQGSTTTTDYTLWPRLNIKFKYKPRVVLAGVPDVP